MSAGRALVRRALREHRALVIPLVLILIANAIVYLFLVRPLRERVGTVTERTRAADAELTAARTLHAQATGTLTGKDQAAEELQQFYGEVLPSDFSAARRLVHPRLAQLARQAGVRWRSISTQAERDPDHTLTELRIESAVTGSYQGVRRFIHQIEQASEFLVIDQMTLTEASGDEALLTVQLELSTYFQESAP